MPAFAEQLGQARIRPFPSANTRSNRSETCASQWLQCGIAFNRQCRVPVGTNTVAGT
jgi:hypothetical protein